MIIIRRREISVLDMILGIFAISSSSPVIVHSSSCCYILSLSSFYCGAGMFLLLFADADAAAAVAVVVVSFE